MSIWKEIKKSINSDLNVPLNERLVNKNAIVSDNENVLASFSISSKELLEFKMSADGSCIVKNITPANGNVEIYINNTQITTLSRDDDIYVLFKRGDVFKIANTMISVAKINILAVHKDLSGLRLI